MKTLLCIFILVAMMSFQTTKPSLSSTLFEIKSEALNAGLCDGTTEGTIQKTLLQNCDGLYSYDATTHKKTKFKIISYEAVCIPKPNPAQIFKNTGAAFSEEVIQFIKQSNLGNQIIFRKISVKAKGGNMQSLNSIPLTIE